MKILSISTLLLTVALATSAHAQPLSSSYAELDWSGFTYTLSNGLADSQIVPALSAASSSADTTRGGLYDQNSDNQSDSATWDTTGVTSQYSKDEGSAASSASTMNGLMLSTANASIGPTHGLQPYGHSQAFTQVDFSLFGTGTGTLTVSVPYRLDLGINPTATPDGTSFLTDAMARVFLYLEGHTGGNDPGSQTVGLNFSNTTASPDGHLIQTGMLTVTQNVTASEGPLIGIVGGTESYATAQRVPEASSVWWLCAGIIGLLGWKLMQVYSSQRNT